jgi:hypothetical protein
LSFTDFYSRVDFFSLDIEGAEMGVLRTIPWDKVDIEVFLVEVRADRESILSCMIHPSFRLTRLILPRWGALWSRLDMR